MRPLTIDPIGMLVVGSGRAARIRVRDAGKLPGVAVRAFCDPVPERAQQRAAEYGLAGPGTWYGDFVEALGRDDIQVVDVCAPVRFHGEIALKAIAAGKHVLMEKPLARSLAEADAMIEAARERGVVLGQIFQNRFHRTPRRIKALLQSGTSRLSIPQLFPFQNDDVLIELVGEHLAVVFTIWGQGVQLRTLPGGSGAADERVMGVRQWFDTLYPDLSDRDGHAACRSDFFSALREGRRPTVTGEEGRRTVELLCGIHKSARDEAIVEFPIARDDPVYRERIWPNP